MHRNLISMLNLCAKAGNLRTGEEQAEKLLQREEAALVIIAGDASQNTQKKFNNKCFYYEKPIRIIGDRTLLSKCAGKENRTVFVVTDAGFAKRLLELIDAE